VAIWSPKKESEMATKYPPEFRRRAVELARLPLQRRAYSVPEVARMLGVGDTAVRNAIARGELRVVRVGGRIVIPSHSNRAVAR
jgi:excisionase family DNA binding protein